MKLKALNILISLFITTCAITACMDTDEMDYEMSSNSSITAFAIKDSIITYYQTEVNGVDTTLSKTIAGTDYPFVISHSEGLIYNPDSLPVGTDVSKVVVSITADTDGIFIAAETDSLWDSKDSLNFTKPIVFKVMAQTGVYGRTYTAKVNVHQQEPEQFSWTKIESNFSPDIQAQKAVYANDNIYVFANLEDHVAMTSSTDGKEWSALTNIDIPVKADYSSAMAWNNQLYILAENELYTSTNGINWNKVETTQTIARLLANVDGEGCKKLMAADLENYYMESTDGINWVRHELLPENFPVTQTNFTSYPLETNPNINRVIVTGNDVKTDTISYVWAQLDTENSWTELEPSHSVYTCPKLENASLIAYNNSLYTFGGPGQHNGSIEAFSSFYQSEDNGISWDAVRRNLEFPEEFNSLYENGNGNYSCIVDKDKFIWIMWSKSGEVWRGRINKFGFEKQ